MGYGIVTRYHGATNHRPSRYIATGPALRSGGRQTRATRAYSYDGPGHDIGRDAAAAIVATLRADGWRVALGDPIALPDESGYVWPIVQDGAS